MNSKTSNPWLVLVILCLGFFMIVLDTTVVNIAIPSIITDLHAPLDQIIWVLDGYILVYAVLLITAGRLGDLYGQRTLFAIGLVLFTGGSAYCGFAPDPTHLIIARLIQGLGGALLTPQSLSILTTIFPPDRRGAAFGVWGAVAGLGAVAGPTLGGALVSSFSWRWIFFMNLPIGVLALIGAFLFVPDLRPGQGHHMDLVGVFLASAGLFAAVYALVEGQRYNWGSVIGPISIPLLLAVGVAIFAGFIFWERTQDEGLLPLSLFRDRNFSLMNVVSIAVGFGMLGLFLPFIIYLQAVLGMSAFDAGIAILPMTLMSFIVAPFAGRLSDRIGGKYVLMFGLTVFGAGMAWMVGIAQPSSGAATFFWPFLITGTGMGCCFAPMATVAMRNIAPSEAGAASGVFNTTRQVGSVLGTAIVGAVLQNQLATHLHAQAVSAAGQLPAPVRDRFIQGINQVTGGGLNIGASSAPALPPGIPAQVAQQLQQIFHQVFVNGYVDAMKPTLAVPIIAVILGAMCTIPLHAAETRASKAGARSSVGAPV